MLDLTTFMALTRRRTAGIPVAIYFHENQLTYPWSPTDADPYTGRDMHYAFINYASALAADHVLFNSAYHRSAFIDALPAFLRAFPDHQGEHTVAQIAAKAEVLHLALPLQKLLVNAHEPVSVDQCAVILWNHRWEFDKNPERFFEALLAIKNRGHDFKLIVLGERYATSPAIFEKAREALADRVLHWGYATTVEEYAGWLHMADILPVTSNQDFFGASVVEAMYCNVRPLLPKRLAYPEHLPIEVHESFFYDEDTFIDQLEHWIKNVQGLRNQQTRSYVQHYDWTEMGASYDARFEAMAQRD
jgi:glycosyltransferase involved in cell wall biosynthesis